MTDFTLYPLKFTPIFKNKLWGGHKMNQWLNKKDAPKEDCGESWEISAIQKNVSVVKNGFLQGNNLEEIIEIYMGDLVGEAVFDTFGIHFPLLIKFIDATDNLSVQVHPDEQTAAKIRGAHSKSELWYVLQADEGAGLYVGFQDEIDKSLYDKMLEEGRVGELLQFYPVHAGDVFYIPGGTIHAIGKGVLLAEIQQASDTTYRIFDWNRTDPQGVPRELHLPQAEKVLDFSLDKTYKIAYQRLINQANPIHRSAHFNVNYLHYSQSFEKIFVNIDSFTIYMCIEGTAMILCDEHNVELTKGETMLIPAACTEISIIPYPKVELLEIF